MAVITKDQPKQINTEYVKAFKNSYYTKQQHKYDRRKPLLPKSEMNRHEANYDKNSFKERCIPKPPQIKSQPDQEKKVPLMKYDKKINTSYTPFTLIIHVIIICQHIYTLYATPVTSVSRMRLASFTQLVYLTTTCFHIATLLANVFKKIKLERAFVLYGTWLIWIGWAMCLWLIRPENRPDSQFYKTPSGGYVGHYYINRNDSIDMYEIEYLLAPMDVVPFLMNGKWRTTTLPIISFFLLLVIRRNHWGLITWEHLVLLDYSSTLKWYRTWCVAGAGASWMLTWEAAKLWLRIPLSDGSGMVLYRTDLPTYPGLFNVLCVSSLAGMFMVCWWSFWTFQYRGVIWKKEFKEGIAVWSSDGWMRVGGIGC